ncbi:hypothetical protein ABZP36_004275 [Zizania latifolia]
MMQDCKARQGPGAGVEDGRRARRWLAAERAARAGTERKGGARRGRRGAARVEEGEGERGRRRSEWRRRRAPGARQKAEEGDDARLRDEARRGGQNRKIVSTRIRVSDIQTTARLGLCRSNLIGPCPLWAF